MSFYSTAAEIAAGDTIIVYSSRTQLNPLVVTPGTQLQSRYGHFKHDDMVGVPYGSKVSSSLPLCSATDSSQPPIFARLPSPVRFFQR